MGCDQNIKDVLLQFVSHFFYHDETPETIHQLWRIGPYQMVYLIEFIEKQFQVEIDPEEVDGDELYSLDGLVSIISDKMQHKM